MLALECGHKRLSTSSRRLLHHAPRTFPPTSHLVPSANRTCRCLLHPQRTITYRPDFGQGWREKHRYMSHSAGERNPDAQEDIDDPLRHYNTLVNEGTLRKDEHQTRIIKKLHKLHEELKDYTPPPLPTPEHVKAAVKPSLLSRLFSRESVETTAPVHAHPDNMPKGLYLFGDVGTGKTMLMDLFYNTLPPSITRKRRVHFHAFMIDVHKRLHATKLAMGYEGGDPLPLVARDLADDAYVLCFDEFQVTDIVDAMILRRLFESLLGYGVVCVITSNRHPDDLYKNGIQRQSFIPCIELLKECFDVTDLDSGTDYRRIPRALSHTYHHPLTPEVKREVDKLFSSLASQSGSEVVEGRALTTWGRKIIVPESSNTVAKFSFDDLCGKPLSSSDFLEITKTFGTIFVTDVPQMDLGSKDKARRFITFIDACYESKTKLFVSSEVPITQAFSDSKTPGGSKDISDHMRSVMDDLGLSADQVGTSSMFTGDEEIFAFARCCSRLVQMGTREWAENAGNH